MEVTVRHLETAASCVVPVTPEETVGSLKLKALRAVFEGDTTSPCTSSTSSAALQGYDEGFDSTSRYEAAAGAMQLRLQHSQEHLGVDATPIANTELQDGAEVELVRVFASVVVKAPCVYPCTTWPLRLSLSPCGRFCAVCEQSDMTVWDTETGSLLRRLAHPGRICVEAVAFSPTSDWLVTGGPFDRKVRVWSISSWRCDRVLEGHTDCVVAASWSPCGRYVVTASFDRCIRVWEAETWECCRVLEGHTEAVKGACVTRSYIVSCSFDRTVRVWDLEGAEDEGARVLRGHADAVTSVTVTPDDLVVSASRDTTVRVYDSDAAWECLHVLQGHTSAVLRVTVLAAGGHVASFDMSCNVRLWDARTGGCLRVIPPAESNKASRNAFGVALTPCGRWLLSAHLCGVRVVSVWE